MKTYEGWRTDLLIVAFLTFVTIATCVALTRVSGLWFLPVAVITIAVTTTWGIAATEFVDKLRVSYFRAKRGK